MQSSLESSVKAFASSCCCTRLSQIPESHRRELASFLDVALKTFERYQPWLSSCFGGEAGGIGVLLGSLELSEDRRNTRFVASFQGLCPVSRLVF
jgi:hypothetical protein